MTADLFADHDDGLAKRETLADGVVLLRAFARGQASDILAALRAIADASPFRQMETPGGYRMSVAMTNCGPLGWVSDVRGYRYAALDPDSGQAWPAMPLAFLALARNAAAEAGFADFVPDACLINRYASGAKLSMHQDKDEEDLQAPIVSVSLGLSASFLLGGLKRKDPTQRIMLGHGDVLVWGGPARLRYHAVQSIKEGTHDEAGAFRFNLTFRKVYKND